MALGGTPARAFGARRPLERLQRQVEAAPASSQIVRGTLRWGGLNIGEAAHAGDGTPKALPRGHGLFVGTSALGQPPPRLS